MLTKPGLDVGETYKYVYLTSWHVLGIMRYTIRRCMAATCALVVVLNAVAKPWSGGATTVRWWCFPRMACCWHGPQQAQIAVREFYHGVANLSCNCLLCRYCVQVRYHCMGDGVMGL